MTATQSITIRLAKDDQAVAKAEARAAETTITKLFVELLTEYASQPAPPARPRAVPQSDRTQTQVEVPVSIIRAARKRADAEGRSISAVITELVLQRERSAVSA